MSADNAPLTDPHSLDSDAERPTERSPSTVRATETVRQTAAYCSMQRTMNELS